MPQQPVEVQKLLAGGKVLKTIDQGGGVFRPVIGKGQRPAYTCGPEGPNQLLLYQCPVSAIPDEVWDLLDLWRVCRLTGLPPVPGGFLDQPKIVQLVFPLFEAMMQGVEAGRQQSGAQHAAGMAVAAMVKALGGGRR